MQGEELLKTRQDGFVEIFKRAMHEIEDEALKTVGNCENWGLSGASRKNVHEQENPIRLRR